jgi:hypothetical protein
VRKTLGDPQDQKQVAQQADHQSQHLQKGKNKNVKLNIANLLFET